MLPVELGGTIPKGGETIQRKRRTFTEEQKADAVNRFLKGEGQPFYYFDKTDDSLISRLQRKETV